MYIERSTIAQVGRQAGRSASRQVDRQVQRQIEGARTNSKEQKRMSSSLQQQSFLFIGGLITTKTRGRTQFHARSFEA